MKGRCQPAESIEQQDRHTVATPDSARRWSVSATPPTRRQTLTAIIEPSMAQNKDSPHSISRTARHATPHGASARDLPGSVLSHGRPPGL
jgi:hypothetical protein